MQQYGKRGPSVGWCARSDTLKVHLIAPDSSPVIEALKVLLAQGLCPVPPRDEALCPSAPIPWHTLPCRPLPLLIFDLTC